MNKTFTQAEVDKLREQRDDALSELTETRRFWQAAKALVAKLEAENAGLREQITTAERRVFTLFKEHWLVAINCNHEGKTDTAICACSMWRCEPQATVGAAVEKWVEHVERIAKLETAGPERRK